VETPVVRYADDFVILCKTEEAAQAALSQVRQWVEANGLTLHPEKTHIGNSTEEGQGFQFLGYHFEGGKRWVRKKSIQRLRDKIRDKTLRTCGQSMKQVIATLNPMLRGWFEYFKHAEPYTFQAIDGFVRRRLRSIGRRHIKKRHGGTGRCLQDHQRWPNTYFTELGLFTMQQARAQLVSQPR
jgi:RNA-directed DNA polymerase